jgi:light-regulated signal transduction histidine kinase (bacteriophytochrome)
MKNNDQSIEAELKNTQQKLKNLEAEYQQYAYIVAHDLSGAFRSISGLSKIIANNNADKLDEESQKHFSLIDDSVRKMQEIMQALLTFSRVNTQSEKFKSVDCQEVLEIAKASLADTIHSSNATIKVNELPTLNADRKQLKQVFYHLLQNAILYRQEDKAPEITISAEEDKQNWIFTIEDNGIGIQEKLLDKVMMPLQRGVKQSDYPGVGMGLTIAKKIIERHGGEIKFNSKVGLGTVINFFIAKNKLN